MNEFISLDEFKKSSEYSNFISNNPDVGTLKVEVFTAYGAIPIENVQILITKKIGDKTILFYNGLTNSSGIIDNIKLPAPPSVEYITEDDYPSYTVYNLTAFHENFESLKTYEVSMYGDIKILQYIKMNPIIDIEGGSNV